VLAVAAPDASCAADGGVCGPLSDAVLSQLGCYLPPSLADTLEAGDQSWMAELRFVSVLFIMLPPCGAGDFALAQALVEEVHRCVQRKGGACQQSLVDDKGTVSVGLWGKPPASHADDAWRAVAAACELSGSLRRIAASFGRAHDAISCGVTTGRAFCGNVGSPSRCEWAVVGSVMNDAARLMASAAAQERPVLCCATTARHVSAFLAEEGGELPAWLSAPPLSVRLKGCSSTTSTDGLPLLMTVHAPLLGEPAADAPGRVPKRSSSLGCSWKLRLPCSDTPSISTPPRRSSSLGAAILGREAELARVSALLRDESIAAGAVMVISGACKQQACERAGLLLD
jgi:hypothetical protein